MMLMKRRDFLKVGAAAGAMATLYGCAGGGKASGHVVVVGGGYGGATIAKYLRMWSEGGVQVTLIERNPTFISCPISNLVIGGTKTMEDITVSYDGLKNKWGVRVIQDEVVAVDAAKRPNFKIHKESACRSSASVTNSRNSAPMPGSPPTPR